MTSPTDVDRPAAIARAGRTAWAAIGIAVLVIGVLWLVAQLRLVVAPLLIALFPAALLAPVTQGLTRRRVPPALAALLTIGAGLALLFAVLRLVVPLVVAEVPSIAASVRDALEQLQAWLRGTPLSGQLEVLEEPLSALQRMGGGGDIAGATLSAVVTVLETAAATLIALVALFFYLKDGGRIARALLGFVPHRFRDAAAEVSERIWSTIGAYFRGQLLVALVDAVGIGIGLLILGVPLALPLAVLVLFGGLFPIVGAVVAGAIAVLVALADQGLVTALLVLAVVIAVQQLEGNVLEPLVLSHAIRLHPLMVLIAITAGAITLGVLGAFLAVPVAASIARVVEYVRENRSDPLPAR